MDEKFAQWIAQYLEEVGSPGDKPPELTDDVFGICGSCGNEKPLDSDYLCRECREANDLADSM